MATLLQTPTLVLNASFEPLNICSARRALVLVLKGQARTEEDGDRHVHSRHLRMPIPSVIRLLEYRRLPTRTRALSRKNILLRDRNTCQYCGKVQPAQALTLDHVQPRSRGGKSSWENLVTCCQRCNHDKGDRTPVEAGMVLLKVPRAFGIHTSRHLMRMAGRDDERWRKYLFY